MSGARRSAARVLATCSRCRKPFVAVRRDALMREGETYHNVRCGACEMELSAAMHLAQARKFAAKVAPLQARIARHAEKSRSALAHCARCAAGGDCSILSALSKPVVVNADAHDLVKLR